MPIANLAASSVARSRPSSGSFLYRGAVGAILFWQCHEYSGIGFSSACLLDAQYLASIYQKLGVSSRTQLARRLLLN
jgi:hypothetical protein